MVWHRIEYDNEEYDNCASPPPHILMSVRVRIDRLTLAISRKRSFQSKNKIFRGLRELDAVTLFIWHKHFSKNLYIVLNHSFQSKLENRHKRLYFSFRYIEIRNHITQNNECLRNLPFLHSLRSSCH